MSLEVSPEFAKDRLESPNNLVNLIHKRLRENHGRNPGSSSFTIEEKANVAVLAEIVGNKEASEILHMPQQQVGQMTLAHEMNGFSKSNQFSEELQEAIDEKKPKKDSIASKAVDIILASFTALTPLVSGGGVKARDLASIAKDASSVVKNLSDDKKGSGITVIIQAPREKSISEFETIKIGVAIGQS